MLSAQRKVFGQSQIGFFIVNRQTLKDYSFIEEENRYNRVVGVDQNLNTANNKWIGKFYTHKSFKPNDSKGNLSSQANLIYNTRIWRFSSDWVYVDNDFTSDLGFIPRTGIFKSGTSARRNFYPNSAKINFHSFSVLNLMWFQQNLDYKKTDHLFRLEYELEFKKQSQLGIEFKRQFVFLSTPFDPSRSENGVPLPR